MRPKSVAFSATAVMAVCFPIAAAHFPAGVGAALSRTFIVLLLLLFARSIVRVTRRRISALLFTPGALFLAYLVVQSLLVPVTAGATIATAISGVLLVLPCLLSLGIAALNDGKSVLLTHRKMLVAFIIFGACSILLDLVGLDGITAGKYGDILPERLGFQQAHGLMPWPNAYAGFLTLFSLLLFIEYPRSRAALVGFILLPATVVRAHIVAAVTIFGFGYKRRVTKYVALVSAIAVSVVMFSDLISESGEELIASSGVESVYRATYIAGAYEAMTEYPLIGLGLNRLSNRSEWERDGFRLHRHYGLPDTLFGGEMASSDTGITFFAEIGLLGCILLLIQIFHFFLLTRRVGKPRYGLMIIPLVLLVYSTPAIFLSVTFGIFYWFLYGELLMAQRNVRLGISA